MKKKSQLPALVKIAVITALTALTWVGFEVYRAFTVTPPLSVAPEVINPLDPELDVTTLDSLFSKSWLDDSEIGDTVLSGDSPVANPTQPEPEPDLETEVELPAETIEEETATPSAGQA